MNRLTKTPAVPLPLMTTEQFFALPEPGGGVRQELHFGVIVHVDLPRKSRFDRSCAIRDSLFSRLDQRHWRIGTSMPYGLTRSYDSRAADVAVCSQARWQAVAGDDFLIGSPELVIQIKSPSNRDRQMEREALAHLTHGASAVWIVKPDQNEVVVLTAASRQVLRRGEELDVLGEGRIAVGSILTPA
jgi:Uma2 family endonuclease